jgi:dienelactone hydrolase
VPGNSPVEDRSRIIRSAFIERLGKLPLVAASRDTTVDRRFTIDHVLFERWRVAGPEGEIPAWFLMPEGATSPLPVIVALHPHGRQFELGKSLVAGIVGDGTRAYGLAAARLGFAVLAPDMLGFEDHRPPLRARKTNYALQGESYERLLAVESLVRGETLQGRMLAELSACADALCREPRVDGGRIALMGQSFGGQQTIFGMLFDSRFRAGVVSCGFSLISSLLAQHISHNLALYVPGLLPDLDFDALVPAIAPRPLTIIAGRRDAIFPIEGVERVEQRARAAWTEAGAEGQLGFRYFDGPHDLPADALAEALDWLPRVI